MKRSGVIKIDHVHINQIAGPLIINDAERGEGGWPCPTPSPAKSISKNPLKFGIISYINFNIWPLRNFFYIMPLSKIFLSNPAYDPNHLELLLSFGWRKDVGAIFRLSLHKRSTCTAYQPVNRNDYYIIYI